MRCLAYADSCDNYASYDRLHADWLAYPLDNGKFLSPCISWYAGTSGRPDSLRSESGTGLRVFLVGKSCLVIPFRIFCGGIERTEAYCERLRCCPPIIYQCGPAFSIMGQDSNDRLGRPCHTQPSTWPVYSLAALSSQHPGYHSGHFFARLSGFAAIPLHRIWLRDYRSCCRISFSIHRLPCYYFDSAIVSDMETQSRSDCLQHPLSLSNSSWRSRGGSRCGVYRPARALSSQRRYALR